MNLLYRKHDTFFILLLIFFLSVGFSNSKQPNKTKKSDAIESENPVSYKTPKYVFLFIGDGMAIPQINLAESAIKEKNFKTRYNKEASGTNTSYVNTGILNIRKFPVVGMQTTNAKDRYITDSAAAATALASGYKTNIGLLGQGSDGTRYKSIAEMARDKGLKVGIVTSVSIDHATPAGFYAHVSGRNNYEKIGNQLLDSDFDYFAGGSFNWDKRKTLKITSQFAKAAKKKGYNFIYTKKGFRDINKNSGKVIVTINKLAGGKSSFENSDNKETSNIHTYTTDGSSIPYNIDYKSEEEENQILLADFTKKGIECLDNPKGFFMMVEGGKIDWACHANDAVTATYETLAFDQAVGVALDFYKKHSNETLIVVTGDHECGGLTLGYVGTHYTTSFDKLEYQGISYVKFSKKVKKWEKDGNVTFGYAMKEIEKYFGLGSKIPLSDYDKKILKTAFNKSMNKKIDLPEEIQKITFGSYDPLTVTATHMLNNKAGIAYGSYSHTGVPLPVFSIGQGEYEFSGYYDNTDIPKKIIKVAGFTEFSKL